MCRQCTQDSGDVPTLRRYDEYSADGFRTETYYRSDQTLHARIRRETGNIILTAPDGEDSHLTPNTCPTIQTEEPGLSDEWRDLHEQFSGVYAEPIAA
jgi:hypothetical protein